MSETKLTQEKRWCPCCNCEDKAVWSFEQEGKVYVQCSKCESVLVLSHATFKPGKGLTDGPTTTDTATGS